MARLAICAAAVAVLASGCGTVHNLSEGEGTPYGGVREDAEQGAKRWHDWCHPSGHCVPPAVDLMFATYHLAVDLPLSTIGDTLTLPWTINAQLKRDFAASDAAPVERNSQPPRPDPERSPEITHPIEPVQPGK